MPKRPFNLFNFLSKVNSMPRRHKDHKNRPRRRRRRGGGKRGDTSLPEAPSMTTPPPIPGLPPGLALAAVPSGTAIMGTPTAAGQYAVPLMVTDSSGDTATATLAITILPALGLNVAVVPPGVVGQPYEFVITPFGGKAPYVITEVQSPTGS